MCSICAVYVCEGVLWALVLVCGDQSNASDNVLITLHLIPLIQGLPLNLELAVFQ